MPFQHKTTEFEVEEFGKTPDLIDFKWMFNRHLNEARMILCYDDNMARKRRVIAVLDALIENKKDNKYVTEIEKINKKILDLRKLPKAKQKTLVPQLEFQLLLDKYRQALKLGARKGIIIVETATDRIVGDWNDEEDEE